MDAVTRSGSTFDYYFASRNPKERLKAITHENRPEGIAIYALCKENPGQIVMIRQFRYPLNDYMYEIPAGLVDPGETPEQSAIREMKEETGLTLEIYEGGDVCFRRPFFMAQGLTDESFRYHLMSAKKNGITKDEIAEIVTHAAFYCGWPKAWAVFRMAKEIWADEE